MERKSWQERKEQDSESFGGSFLPLAVWFFKDYHRLPVNFRQPLPVRPVLP